MQHCSKHEADKTSLLPVAQRRYIRRWRKMDGETAMWLAWRKVQQNDEMHIAADRRCLYSKYLKLE